VCAAEHKSNQLRGPYKCSLSLMIADIKHTHHAPLIQCGQLNPHRSGYSAPATCNAGACHNQIPNILCDCHKTSTGVGCCKVGFVRRHACVTIPSLRCIARGEVCLVVIRLPKRLPGSNWDPRSVQRPHDVFRILALRKRKNRTGTQRCRIRGDGDVQ
jgi:hypothetical protein